MKSATSAQRPYQEVGAMIRDLIIKTPYNPGERLPPEREIAEMLDVTRTVVREALIMLEIKGLVEVRRGAGIYVLDNSGSQNTDSPDANVCNDAGPFELLQARQLLESNIAEFAALQATREDIVKCVRHCNWKSVNWLPVRRAAAKAVTCSSISLLPKQRITACWWSCSVSPGSGGKTIQCGSSCTAIWMTACIAKSGWAITNRSSPR
ncbi:uxu operon transcriptional regulator [Escherichia coli]|uniref:Uxu operon transcriptional regulator n=1 Tax=Escherichia coli TaxID=562 RepID=A0A2X1Q0L0_ECOLX|nr:uxu operon transcriptional regulator [Escherichia coli]